MSKFLCWLFGHRMMDVFTFKVDGFVRATCARDCGHFFEAEMPPQHVHEWGRPFNQPVGNGGPEYVKKCRKCPAVIPVKRRKKVEAV